MKRLSALVFACGAGSCALTSNATAATHVPPVSAKAKAAAQAAAYRKHLAELAPADQYFGPLQQSMIGMRNTIRDLGLRYDVNHDIPKETFASAQLTERGVRDWEKKYPHDTSIPSVVFRLQRLYTKILYQPARDRAGLIAAWMYHDFGSSPAAKQLRKTIAADHLAPLNTPPPVATPAPIESATPAPLPSGSLLPQSPFVVGTPGAQPAPLVSPTPAASTTPLGVSGAMPSTMPTAVPSTVPTAVPSTAKPSAMPSTAPTGVPSTAPTTVPSMMPTAVVTATPAVAPTIAPAATPTAR